MKINVRRPSETKVSRARQEAPDLQTQLETLLDTVWHLESWERTHPFTVAALRGNGAVNRYHKVELPEGSAA